MIKILIISANEIRHKYFRKKISQFKNIKIGLCVVEKNSTRQFYNVMSSDKFTIFGERNSGTKYLKDQLSNKRIVAIDATKNYKAILAFLGALKAKKTYFFIDLNQPKKIEHFKSRKQKFII